jgi:hypothetical protein
MNGYIAHVYTYFKSYFFCPSTIIFTVYIIRYSFICVAPTVVNSWQNQFG